MKKALKITVDVIAWVVIVLAAVMTVTVFTSQNKDGISRVGDTMMFTIQSPSMKGTINKGDVIFSKKVKDIYNDIKVDDIITFWGVVEGEKGIVTHRVVAINPLENGLVSFQTAGDNNLDPSGNVIWDSYTTKSLDVIGKYQFRIPVVGYILDFLKTSVGFFCCIILPLALFFVYQLYIFIKVLLENKQKTEAAAAPAGLTAAEEEAIKEKAIAEYLAKQKAEDDKK